MKKVFYLMLFAAIALFSCSKHYSPEGVDLQTVTVQLIYPANSSYTWQQGVAVKMTGSNGGSSFDATTDASGKATFNVPAGIYDISATDTRSDGGTAYLLNGVQTLVTITSNWLASNAIPLNLTQSKAGEVIIKEIFVGGSLKDDGSGVFTFDNYITLYNNATDSNAIINLDSICLAVIAPYNSQAKNAYTDANGNLTYVSQGWIPAAQAFWHFQNNVKLLPGKQLVIALCNAVDNTVTYSKSIDFNHPGYYCTYDINKFSSTNYYVTPGDSIPTSHYLKAEVYGLGKAWALSVTSPGAFLFTPQGTTPTAFGADVSQTDVTGGYTSKKVPMDWVVDGVEVYAMNETNHKRFPSNIDAGSVLHAYHQGYSVYRNVDKAATEAYPGNTGKIVMGYNLGTTDVGGSSDPSGIDAEASIKNGAHIIYMDTNNSTNDFHLRKKASLSNY